MQEFRASTKSDTASTARPHVAEVQQSIVQPTEGIIAGTSVAQPVADKPQTGGSGAHPGGNKGNSPHSQISAKTVQGRVEVGNSRQHFATLRPDAPKTFPGKPVEL
jgi:hypothetical protein